MAKKDQQARQGGEGYAVILYADCSNPNGFNPDYIGEVLAVTMDIELDCSQELVADAFNLGRRVMTITTQQEAARMAHQLERAGILVGIDQR